MQDQEIMKDNNPSTDNNTNSHSSSKQSLTALDSCLSKKIVCFSNLRNRWIIRRLQTYSVDNAGKCQVVKEMYKLAGSSKIW